MEPLSSLKCEACRRGAPTVTPEEEAEFGPQVPEWRVMERDGVRQLEREFTFPDFLSALEFANRVGALAEEENHHPTLRVEWGRVAVTWWTHKIRGLHRNDFILAARTDRLYAPR